MLHAEQEDDTGDMANIGQGAPGLQRTMECDSSGEGHLLYFWVRLALLQSGVGIF